MANPNTDSSSPENKDPIHQVFNSTFDALRELPVQEVPGLKVTERGIGAVSLGHLHATAVSSGVGSYQRTIIARTPDSSYAVYITLDEGTAPGGANRDISVDVINTAASKRNHLITLGYTKSLDPLGSQHVSTEVYMNGLPVMTAADLAFVRTLGFAPSMQRADSSHAAPIGVGVDRTFDTGRAGTYLASNAEVARLPQLPELTMNYQPS